MPTIHYPFRFNYAYDREGNLLPRRTLTVFRPDEPSHRIEVDGYLDSGAERSLFDGWIGTALGLDVPALGGPASRSAPAGHLVSPRTTR
jgi:hypothetical protein